MTDRVFLDTNVLVYAFDRSDPARHDTAAALLTGLLADRSACVSTQVLKELYVVATRKVAAPLSHEAARAIIEDLSQVTVVEETVALLTLALDLVKRLRWSLWDAAILAAARIAGCSRLLTEDLQHGRVVDGVRVENPFLERPAEPPPR
jgi:predicted nucleic acid-binding protein